VPEPAELRFLHWNIHSWRDAAGAPNAAAVTTLILGTAPDVVSLTEVNEPWGSPDTLAQVAAACGYSWLFVPCIEYGKEPSARGYGNALLTRVPVTGFQQLTVYSPDRRYDGSEPAEDRTIPLARLHVRGTTVWAGGTHFPATHHDSRKIAASKLIELTRKLGTPWIICGDFNAAPAALFTGRGELRVFPESPEPTFPAHRPRVPIDYCLASPDLVVKTEVLRTPGSDHLPLLTVARW
jgi:endonuclease/exonuclease/phosphatase family metal-dependent hydrolase